MTLVMSDIDNIGGMTVNERLFHFGLFQEFESAVKTRQISEIVNVLQLAKFTEAQAHETASAIIANPSFYGY
jgi:hypothetical protein